jgi:hypothetical protein
MLGKLSLTFLYVVLNFPSENIGIIWKLKICSYDGGFMVFNSTFPTWIEIYYKLKLSVKSSNLILIGQGNSVYDFTATSSLIALDFN